MIVDVVPAELRERRQWIVWRYERRDGKETKVPYSARTGQRASSTDAATWTDFDTAASFARQPGVAGIGYVFADADPFVGIDLDNCMDGGGLHPAARELVENVDSYTECSPPALAPTSLCAVR